MISILRPQYCILYLLLRLDQPRMRDFFVVGVEYEAEF